MDQPNYSLHRHEPLRDGFLRAVDELTDSVSDNLTHPPRNGVPDIHGIRTTIKRLRALLRLVRPAVGPAFFNRENARLRAAAQLLSFARDTEVARQTLKTLPVSAETDRDAVQAVLAGFESRVEVPVDLDDNLAEVKRRVEQTRRDLHRLQFRWPERDVLATGLGTVYRQGRKRMKAAIELGQDNAFHRWRIRAKNLYYELEFLESIWPGRFHRLISRLSKLQDEIGLDHDAAVLRAWLKKTPENFGDSETVERVVGCLDSKIQELRKGIVPLGRRIWREKPRRFTRRVMRHWRKR
jgi:CHAD domain-containing protein